MALKFNLKNVSAKDVEDARKDFGGGYDGPPAPPGLYNAAVKQLWFRQTKSGKDMIVAHLKLQNEGDAAEYNGLNLWYNMLIPGDPSDRAFTMQMKNIDDFFRAASGGKMDVQDFVDAAKAGKILTGESDNKKGEEITQVGKLKIEKAQDMTVKTKIETYNGEERTQLHWIDTSKLNKADSDDDDVDADDDVDMDDDYDIDQMMDDMDD